ncbi:hypothetical protein BDW75DRAFT_200884, partial [Aspergillus navahoensis]
MLTALTRGRYSALLPLRVHHRVTRATSSSKDARAEVVGYNIHSLFLGWVVMCADSPSTLLTRHCRHIEYMHQTTYHYYSTFVIFRRTLLCIWIICYIYSVAYSVN